MAVRLTKGQRVFDTVFRRASDLEQGLPAAVDRNVPSNALRLVGAATLQNSGDQAVNASTVLPWLFHALGVPPALVGLLVPIRESGSMLPQALLTPMVLRVRHRKWVFVAGALVQASMVAAMALVAAFGNGLSAGVLILMELAVFSLGRSLCSIASKDVQGRTIPKGTRGQVNGFSATVSGVVAVSLGLVLRTVGGGDLSAAVIAWLFAGGAVVWLLAALVYARVREPAGNAAGTADDEGEEGGVGADASWGWLASSVRLLREDVQFRRFVMVRSLLLVSALSPPFVVTLAASSGAVALSGIGGFVIASGLSALIAGPVFGRIADRSSRNLMVAGSGVASAVLVVLVILTRIRGFDGDTVTGTAVFVGTYFVLTLVHTGVRLGRKTYVVDMATGDQRTEYVAVSNSAMGVVLLAAGGISSALSVWGVHWALLFLAGLGFLGIVAAARLPDVSAE